MIDAVGMEAHGTPLLGALQKGAGLLPGGVARKLTEHVGVDRLGALYDAMRTVRRGGTLSVIGVYGGQTDPFPMMELFDRGVTIRMGQAHVRRWTDAILPYLSGDNDPLGVEDLASHRLPLAQAPQGYEMFQSKRDGAIKVVLDPWGRRRSAQRSARLGRPPSTAHRDRTDRPAGPGGGVFDDRRLDRRGRRRGPRGGR